MLKGTFLFVTLNNRLAGVRKERQPLIPFIVVVSKKRKETFYDSRKIYFSYASIYQRLFFLLFIVKTYLKT